MSLEAQNSNQVHIPQGATAGAGGAPGKGEKPKPLTSLLTPKETAKRLRVTVGTLKAWRYEGKGPPYLRLGRTILYDADDIDAHLAASKVHPAGASA